MIREIEGANGMNMGDFEWWGRGSFKTRDVYREAGKDLKQGFVAMEGE